MNGHLLLLEGCVLLLKGRGERGDGRLLALELGFLALKLGLLALELGLLRLERLILLLKHRSSLPRLGLMRLGLLGLLVSCGPLRVVLAEGSGQLSFQPTDPRLQGCLLVGPSVGLAQLRHQDGIVLLTLLSAPICIP